MNKVIILVACHKPDKVFQNDVYTPIHVGRAVSKCNEAMSDIIGDDTGVNISEKNPSFCELTAQYWAWKNLKDVDYVGLCHYRRYFQTEITNENVEDLFEGKYDVILGPKLEDKVKIGERLIRATCLEDVYLFVKCLQKVSPAYYETAMDVLSNNVVSPFNMFVMDKYRFDDFAEWQFGVLFEMEKYAKPSGYSRMRRVYGYLSEMMLTTYSLHNHLRIKHLPIVSMLGEDSPVILGGGNANWLRRLLIKKLFIRGRFSFGSDSAIEVGLRNDGIEL